MNVWVRWHTFFLDWTQKRLNERQFLILSSAMIGLTAGLAAVILKTFVHYIHDALTDKTTFISQYYLYPFFPLIGLLLVVTYVKRFHKGTLEKGTSFVLYSISRKSSLLAPLHMFAHVITSGITIGFGGSSGLEAPIAVTGSAIGSNFSRTYHLNYKNRTLLLSCGAAAGIAAAFNAPIAGVLFAIEVLLIDISATAFIPLIIAAAIGTLCSKVVLQQGILMSFTTQQSFDFSNTPYYLLLGLFAGFISIYHSRVFVQVDNVFDKIKQPYAKAITGGALLILLIFLFPPLFGEGYSSIISLSQSDTQSLLVNSAFRDYLNNEWLVLLFLGVIIFIKVVATAATLSGGGNGGNFAPSLMVGAFSGFFFARLINLTGFTKLPESNFTLVAMAGVMTGVMHAPLTAIFLIAEITGGYGLMVPLMIVSAVAYVVVKIFEPDSIDNKKLAKKGELITHDRDKKILSYITLEAILEKDFQPVYEKVKLRELITIIEKSHRNVYPVITEENRLAGIIQLDSIREIMFHQELYDTVLIKELMQKPLAVISMDESMDSVMQKFDNTHAWNLPVVSSGKYVGFISKSVIFNKYRNHLIERSVQ
jgi:chloride channel protein, CIC family